MRIDKASYLIIAAILHLSFWNVRPVMAVLNRDMILVLLFAWGVAGFYLFPGNLKLPVAFFKKHCWILFCIVSGLLISTLNAYIFRGQAILTTFIAQRFVYSFVLIWPLIYIQPTMADIVQSIRMVSYITLVAWLISIVYPQFYSNVSESAIQNKNSMDIGFYVAGIHIVVLYTYYLIYRYIRRFTYKDFVKALLWVLFVMLYQNRSLMIGVIIVFLFSLTKLKSQSKPIVLIAVSIVIVLFLINTADLWIALIDETNSQLADQDYNRWKALKYYLYSYSPNFWCYIFGNGMPSGGNSAFGNLYWYNMERGIYTSDLGMIGMWINYGILPLVSIYYILFKMLFCKEYPLWLKFISFHILIVPTIFNFGTSAGVYFFVILIYTYMYYSELSSINTLRHILNQYACRNHRKLQK